MKIGLVAYGDLGKYVEAMLRDTRGLRPEDFVLFDDVALQGGDPRARAFADHVDAAYAGAELYVCLGYKHLVTKRRILDGLARLGRKLPAFIHPSCIVDPTAKIAEGAYIYSGAVFDRNVRIGRGTTILNGCIVPHDCTVGSACWLAPGVTLSGNVVVEDSVFLGSGTTVSNDVTIGEGAIIGLATAVTKNVPAGASVIGNPMRVLSKPLALL